MRLIAIPYAFGNANIYCELFDRLTPELKKSAVEYSGHGRRFSDKLFSSMEEIVDDVYKQVKAVISHDEEYCLLGYSMGGLVAYELYYKMLSCKEKLPIHIFIMGTPEPDYIHKYKEFESFDLSQIKDELIENEGTPQEVIECDELIELLTPVIKADNIALRDYRNSTEKREPMKCKVTVIRGTLEDELENCREGWEKNIGHECEYILIEGKHFFLFEEDGKNTDSVAGIIEKTLLLK